jgi:hypothetical protein
VLLLNLAWRNAHACFLSLRCECSDLRAISAKTIIQIYHFFANFNLFIPLFFTTLDGVPPPSLPSAKMFPDTHLPVLGAKTLPDGREEIKEIQQHGFFKKISIFLQMEFQVDFEMLWY